MAPSASDPRGYLFGRFHLSADGTLLLRDGAPVALAPKVLQTLRALVERPGEVVRKDVLMRAVWGDTSIEETGLTRNISLLRQAIGDAEGVRIATVARVGYRFAGPVARGGPVAVDGLPPRADRPASAAAYEYYLRGNEAMGPQGIASVANLRVARALYAQALEEDPRFASAWARLGRCHYLIGKIDQRDHPGDSRAESLARAETCFREALAINPDLGLAHDLAALVDVDRGRARDAMVRLIGCGLRDATRPELFAALIQACRYCGLLEASVAAHHRARALAPAIPTGGYQSLWQLGDDEGALREAIRPYLLRAIITGMRGDRQHAIAQLEELEARALPDLTRDLSAGIRGVFEGRRELTLTHAQRVFETSPDPEYWFFASRTVAAFGDASAFAQWARALDAGYVLYRVLLRRDAWLDPLRDRPEFRRLFDASRDAYRAAAAAYDVAGGGELLGRAHTPEELEATGAVAAPAS